MPANNVKATPEAIAEWAKVLDEVGSYAGASRVLGINHQTLRRWLPGRGLKGSKPPTAETIAEWKTLLDEGYAYKHVSEIHNVDRNTVKKYCPGYGWTRQQISEHGALVSRTR